MITNETFDKMACKSYLFYVSFKTLKGYCLKYAKHFIIYDVNIQ